MGIKKPRALGKATGPHKLKKTHISSDSSDEDDELGDGQVCQSKTITILSVCFGYSVCLTGC